MTACTSRRPSCRWVSLAVAGSMGPTTVAKNLERYRQLAEQQILPHLGSVALQKLRPARITGIWHAMILKTGGMGGRPLSARTVGHAHRVLHRALERAMRLEIIARNVAHLVRPPKVETSEVVILAAGQLASHPT